MMEIERKPTPVGAKSVKVSDQRYDMRRIPELDCTTTMSCSVIADMDMLQSISCLLKDATGAQPFEMRDMASKLLKFLQDLKGEEFWAFFKLFLQIAL